MIDDPLHHGWDLTVARARDLQLALRERVDPQAPPAFAPRTVAGADVSVERFATRGYAGIVTLDVATMETVEAATSVAELKMPYVPGYLSFRELPALDGAWRKLTARPDVVIFDGQGYAHPRRFGIACHGGVRWDVPTIGCAKSILVGTHGELAPERGSVAPLVHAGETVGMAVRTRDGVNPVYVSPGHRMDLDTAVRIVLAVSPKYREPETTRRSHRLVNDARRADRGA
ncbi:MAG TPA: deoxyribonuclease V [Longimicrobium sp.]|nr:deoxyribonuclease V [Longimicrobium sp.]